MSIVVVGHGRSPEGKWWGSKIDEHTVIRMWDWFPWQGQEDYGTRYDYGLFVMTPKGVSIFNQHNEMHPRKAWLAYQGKPTPLSHLSSRVLDRLVFVDTTPWCKIAAALGGAGLTGRLTLTRGCAAAAWAVTQARSGDAVVLVGFDNIRVGTNRPIEESFCPEYWAQYMARFKPNVEKVYPMDQPKTATHDMAIELPLLQFLAKEHKVRLKFAEEVW